MIVDTEERYFIELFSKSAAATNKPLQRHTFDKLTGNLHRFLVMEMSVGIGAVRQIKVRIL